MIFFAVGPSNCGKTFLVREWLLPTLLTDPGSLSNMAPARFKYVLIDDRPSRKRPQGQYGGERYRDVSEWRRAGFKSLVSCFEGADPRELVRLALELGDVVLVLDELDLRWPNWQALNEDERELVNRGRHEGVALVGTMRRLHGVRPEVRANMQTAFFAGLVEPDDRAFAAKTAGVDEEVIREPWRFIGDLDGAGELSDGKGERPRIFLELRRETGDRHLSEIRDGVRVVHHTF